MDIDYFTCTTSMKDIYIKTIPEEYNEKVGSSIISKELNNMEKSKWDFIYSPVFWQLFLVGVAVGLNFPFPNNVWVQGLSAMLGVWFGGSVGVNTFNKRGEKMVEVANISAKTTTVTMPANVGSVQASKDSTLTGTSY